MSFNSEQLQAIEYNHSGPVAVIAGAGTGKTTVLINRIEYLINKLNYNPFNILVITFTNKVSKELNLRLSQKGITNLDWVGTFHSICYRILRQHINALGRDNNFKIIDQDESMQLIKSIYQEFNYSSNELSHKNCLNIIDGIKRKFNIIGYDDEKAHEYILSQSYKYPTLQNSTLFYMVWKEYENRLLLNNYLDFNDLLSYTVYLLENHPTVQEYWIKKFNYILVDEFQDTNDIQYQFLRLILNDNKNIFVVGDADQTIYSFRGSNPTIINRFIDDLNATKIILHINYRSTQSILDAANDLINKNSERIKKELLSHNNNMGEKPILYEAYNDFLEASYVVGQIKNLIEEGVKPSQICILLRANYLTRNFEEQLMYNNIDYKIYGGIKFYQRTEIKDLLAYLSLASNSDELAILRTINLPSRKIGDRTISLVKEFENGLTFYRKLLNYNNIDISQSTKNSIASYLELINKIRDFKYTSIVELLEFIIEETKILDYYADKDISRIETIKNNIDQLKQAIKEFESHNPESTIDNYLAHMSLILDNESNNDVDCVKIMTVHNSKGLEFDYVFLPQFNQNIFPSRLSIEDGINGIEEERRTAYVALTRAKQKLFISYSIGQDLLSYANKKPSMFLKDINPIYLEHYRHKQKTSNSYREHLINKVSIEENFNHNLDISMFNVGDFVNHSIFGVGSIISIEGNNLVIMFKSPINKKTIAFNHKSITKVFN